VKGILEKLDEIERRDPDYAAFTGELRELAKRFRLDAYSKRLGQLPRERADSP